MDITLDWLGVSTFRVVIDDLVIFLDATATESAVVARGRGSEQDVFGGSMADWLGQGLSMGRFGQRRARRGCGRAYPTRPVGPHRLQVTPQTILDALAEGLTVTETAHKLGTSRASVYRGLLDRVAHLFRPP